MTPQEAKRNKIFDQANEERRYCWGCGQTGSLSRAHIVRYSSIPFEGAKIALKMDITNMSYLCLSISKKGCHDIWDNNSWTILKEFEEIHKLNCLVEFMKVIEKKDPNLYKERIEIINNWMNYYQTGDIPFGYKLK